MIWQTILAWVVIGVFVVFVVMPIITHSDNGYLESVKLGASVLAVIAALACVGLAMLWALDTVGLF